jgi:hypothetical protein
MCLSPAMPAFYQNQYHGQMVCQRRAGTGKESYFFFMSKNLELNKLFIEHI